MVRNAFGVNMTVSIQLLFHPGSRILTVTDIPKQDLYLRRLKGVTVALNMFKFGLMGNYCNFGVFLLYGDRTLDEGFQVYLKLMTSIQHSDLLVPSSPLQYGWISNRFPLGIPEVGAGLLQHSWHRLSEPHRFSRVRWSSGFHVHFNQYFRRNQFIGWVKLYWTVILLYVFVINMIDYLW